jgi:enterochelin esterase family protein
MARQTIAHFVAGLGLLLLAALPQAAAQPQKGKGKGGAKGLVVSPQIHEDRKVTFRIHAPKASEVTVRGDWMTGREPVKLDKGKDGVWSATVGPLVPDFYSYSFTVDGVRTIDPRNPTIKQGIASLDSMFFLPGKEAAFQENREVPHGEVRQVWYKSATLGTQRRMHVYTPPGYDAGKDRYPVLYLLHGGGDEDSGWSTVGRAGFILDNLIAQKKARPMLVVMPNGSLPRPPAGASRAEMQDRFTNELLKDVVPHVEKNYRVLTGRDNRALAGLSMGGGQTLRVVTTHPDQFAYVAVWSAGLFGGNTADFEKQNAKFLARADEVNKQVKLFAITVGEKDFALAGSKALAEVLKKHRIKNELRLTEGGHTWINWRRYLNELAPRLFRDK